MLKKNIKIKIYVQNFPKDRLLDILKKLKKYFSTKIFKIGLPTRVKKVTVLKAPAINKKAREQYQKKTKITLIVLESKKKKLLAYGPYLVKSLINSNLSKYILKVKIDRIYEK